MTPLSDLYHDGRRYDLLYGAGDQDISFYSDAARRFGDPILELACGTGRYLVPLAQAGHDVAGVDLSEAMLAEAARKSKAAGVSIEFAQMDMRGFGLSRKFGLVFIAGNSLVHLQTREDIERFLRRVREHLRVDGTLVLDVFVPDVRLLARDAAERRPFGAYDDPHDGVHTEVSQTTDYDPIAQINEVRLHSRRADSAPETEMLLSLRMWFPAELEAILHYNGFAIIEKLGGHHGGPLNPRSGKQILICRVQ